MAFITLILLSTISWGVSALLPYRLVSSTGWIIDPVTDFPDFSASITLDQRPTIFQHFYYRSPALFVCRTRTCSDVSTVSMPGLDSAQFFINTVSPRHIQQYSPYVTGAQFILSQGYWPPNKYVELVVCSPSDPSCAKPSIQNTVDMRGFGQAGLRLTFTRQGLPIMIIPDAGNFPRDYRITDYIVQTCSDPLCAQGLASSHVSLPFNLTGKANCEDTSVDVALNQFGFPTWLTLCGPELNLIHCLTPSCNQTSAIPFVVNRDFVDFVYLAVDSQFRFSISTTGQTAQSDITYIRCLDADCAQSVSYQYALPSTGERRQKLYGKRVQHVIDRKTDLPVFHFVGREYPSEKSVYMFIACGDVECSDMTNIVDYGVHLGINKLRVSDVFADDQGVIIASLRANYATTNQTINLIVRIARAEQQLADGITFIQI